MSARLVAFVSLAQADAQAARDIAQAQQQAFHAAARAQQQALHAALDAVKAQHAVDVEVQGTPAPPALPGEPKVTVNPDGRMTVVSPDGSTTILYPDGRTTHVRANGEVEQTGVPGGTDDGIPQSVQNVIEGFFMTVVFVVVGFPLARAFARRLDRSAPKARAMELSPEFGERMDRLEHAVDSIAVEVERISEGQRFTTKLMSEMRAPASAQLPGAAPAEGAPARRAEPAAAVPVSDRRS